MKVKEILLRQAKNDRLAIRYGENTISYCGLNKGCQWLKSILQQLESSGNNIGIFLPNSINFALAYFSIALMDKVIVPIGIQAKEAEIQSTVAYCELRVVMSDTYYGEKFKTCVNGLEAQVILLNVETGCCEVIHPDCHLIPETENLGGTSEDCVAILLHTSGTTSHPKRVMLTHANVIENIRSNIASLRLTDQDISLIALPMFFGYCHTAQFLTHLYLGASIVILDSLFLPKVVFETIETFRITNLTAVPAMLLMLLTYRYTDQYDLSSLRFVCFGGGNMPVDRLFQLIQRFPTLGFIQTYGLTEASPRVTALLPSDMLNKIGSVGLPIPRVEIRIVDENGNDVTSGAIGEIAVRGKNVMRGYYKRPIETAQVFKNGWLLSGDLGQLDGEGYLYIMGRKKNIIISGGINIYPEEIEEVLLGNLGVKEALVFSEQHAFLSEVPVAQIVLQENGTELTEKQVIAYCRERLAEYKVPLRVEFVKELSRTATGKIKRSQE